MRAHKRKKLLVMPLRRAAEVPEPAEEVLTCVNCGAPEVVEIERSGTTGVQSPDNCQETWLERRFQCLACGHIE
jgi:transcription elongation factor Elf1